MSGFEISFIPGAPGAGMNEGVEIPTFEDGFEALVIEACDVLGGVNGAEFVLTGFGRRWPVDVAYDMSVFTESLPALVEAIRASEDIDVDTYSQGIECSLGFHVDGDVVEVYCMSRTSWVPDPSREVIARAGLLDMLTRFAKSVADGLATAAPELAVRDPFDHWRRGEV